MVQKRVTVAAKVGSLTPKHSLYFGPEGDSYSPQVSRCVGSRISYPSTAMQAKKRVSCALQEDEAVASTRSVYISFYGLGFVPELAQDSYWWAKATSWAGSDQS